MICLLGCPDGKERDCCEDNPSFCETHYGDHLDAAHEDERPINIGVHTSHCCKRHGCKYGDDDRCPVENGSHPQEHSLCEACAEDVKQHPDLMNVLRNIINENNLREAHGEDTIGVLTKCGAFKWFDVVLLAREIDKPRSRWQCGECGEYNDTRDLSTPCAHCGT